MHIMFYVTLLMWNCFE